MPCLPDGTVVSGMDFCVGTSPYRYHLRFIYTGDTVLPGGNGCMIDRIVDTNCSNAIYPSPSFGNGPSKNYRKFWHIELNIRTRDLNQLPTPLSTIKTHDVDRDITANWSTATFAKYVTCGDDLDIPIPAFDSSKAPGWFVFYPTNADIEDAYVNISNFDDAVNGNNRRIFEYNLLAAYNDTDTNCTATSPNTIDYAPHDILVDGERAVCWNISALNPISVIGCCELQPPDQGVLLPLADVSPICNRLWIISDTDGSGNNRLYSFDLDTAEFTNRGNLETSSALSVFSDIAWDDRGFLWGIEDEGLHRVLVGSETQDAISVNPAIITKNQPSFPDLFPLERSDYGYTAMSFSKQTGRLYIGANSKFWELEKRGDNAWEIMKYSDIPTFGGNTVNLEDIAFSPSGTCYAVYVDRLVTMDYQSEMNAGFGVYTLVGSATIDSLSGLDFMTSESDPDNPILYGINDAGQMMTINTLTAAPILTGDQLGFISLGMSGCQTGEDARLLPFPYYPGLQPWCFMVDTSNSMANNNSLNRIKSTLILFLQNYIRRGDVFSLVLFNDQPAPRKFLRQMVTEDDVQLVIDFINANMVPSGNTTNFCGALDFVSQVGNLPGNLKSIVVLSDGTFDDCTGGSSQVTTLLDAVVANKPDVTFYAVGMNPSDDSLLTVIGEYNNGGYTLWNN